MILGAGNAETAPMLTDLLLVRAQMRRKLDLETAGRLTCWWGRLRRRLWL
jgi:hypothetical protein